MKKIWLALLLLLPSLVWAGDRYQIEVVIFEQNNQPTVEQNPTYVDEYDYYNKAKKGVILETLSSREHQLGSTVYALRKGNYRLINHSAWRHDLPLGERSDYIRVAAGQPLVMRDELSVHEFDGVMTFKQMRGYIHATIDCLFQQDTHNEEIFRLKQSARIKLNEIQYIDHPRFGIMLKVTPVADQS